MKRILLSAALLAFAAASGVTATTAASAEAQAPRWLRNAAISPDASTIAFTYKGDIFTVPVAGGMARQITSNPAYDTNPVWSPDGRTLVFASAREGSMDLYAVDANGGTPRRLTTVSSNETPLGFLDSKTLLYSAAGDPSPASSRMPTRLTKTYKIDITQPNARPVLYLSMPMGAVSASNDGRILYQDRKGLEDVLRKHERSSGTADIWLIENGNFKKLTDFQGHDMNPQWRPDGKGYYYISEQDGTLNVWSAGLDGSRQQLTKFEKHPVRSLSAASNGMLAFSWDGDLYTLTPGGQPQKVNVNIVADQYDGDRVKKFVNSGASQMAVSPDGKEVAFVIRGDIYVTDTEYKTTRRITDTPAQERVVEFSPDGRKLVYDSDRDGQWQLFTAEIKNPAEKRFAYATEIVEKPLYKGEKIAQQPAFSPDGKMVAFLEDRTELRVMDLKTKKVTTVLPAEFNYSYTDGDVTYAWSPDSKWLLASYIGKGGWNNVDVALVSADGKKIVNLTESGYTDTNPRWALGGKAITYATGKYGMKSHGSWGNQDDVVLMAFDQEAWDDFNATEEEAKLKEAAEKEKKEAEEKDSKDKKDKKSKKGKKADKDSKDVKPLDLDIEGRRHRMRRLTGESSSLLDYYLSPKGDKLYYIAEATEGGYNLLERNLREGDTKVLVKGVSGGIAADAKGENLFVLGGSGIKKVDLAKGDATPVEFDAPYDRVPSLEREYIYDHMLRQVADKFYDVNLHGVDWDYYGKHYREFLPYIDNNEDFAILLSEILGELNASHTGGRYFAPGAKMQTASLGVLYDDTFNGDGLRVAEVVAGSPLSSKKAGVKKGDVILAIDGEKILAGRDYAPLLEGKADRKTMLQIRRAGGKLDTVSVKPLSGAAFNDLLYQRWVERNEAYVDSLSNGRVGYVHIQGMDSPSFRTAYDRILGKYRNCDAVVVDTRWNGGGWLHNDIAKLLGGKEYVRFMPRGRYIGSEPFSQWYKPSVMLVNEGNYSDAHGTPVTYRALNLGKIVGAPVPGTMTAVWWETQIDPTLVFGIPQVTNADLNGQPFENHQLDPDVTVYNNPADELRGRDAQLEEAVKTVLSQVK